MATEYSIENARIAVPHLIECARNKQTITYGELTAKIGRHHRAAPHLLEYLLRVCHKLEIPTIGTLVVSKTTGLPGDGFILDQKTKKLEFGSNEYQRQVKAEQNKVYAHKNWDTLKDEFGLD
ncbi:MAG: hypothetical protein ACRYFS_26005 [Janthinobacterium lividum]